MAPKKAKPRAAAKAEAKDLCKEAEGCIPPHAKIWEKAAALLSYLVASRIKKENNLVDLVEEARKAYPACLDEWLDPNGQYLGVAVEEKWGSHPANNSKKRGRGDTPVALDVRL